MELVVEVVPVIHETLPDPSKRGQDAVAWQLRGEDRQVEARALSGDHLRHAPAGLGGIHYAVTAVAQGIENPFARIRLEDAWHHIVADVDPSPPRVIEIDALERGE